MRKAALFALAGTMALSVSALANFGPMTLPWDDLGYNASQGWETFTWGLQLVRGDIVPAGQGPTVYIIDGGVGYHEDLTIAAGDRVNPYSSKYNLNVSLVGCYPHATHVAGIIGARLGNRGVAGIAAGVRMVSVSALVRNVYRDGSRCGDTDKFDAQGQPTESMTKESVLEALAWVRSQIQLDTSGKTAVVNISTNGTLYTDPAIRQAMRDLTQPIGSSKGALVAQSAGNQFNLDSLGNACNRAYNPGSSALPADGVMVVGAIQARRNASGSFLAHFANISGVEPGSNYGSCVDIYAPGKLILSTYNNVSNNNACNGIQLESTTYSGSCYLEGTSMAAPHVAGIAARLLKDEPYLSPGELETRIRSLSLNVGTFDAPLFVARLPSYDTDNDSLPNFAEYLKGRNPNQKDNDIFATNLAFVEQQYRDFWDRERDPYDQYLGQLDAGTATRPQVMDAFLRSAEHYDTRAPIVRLYLACFLRSPDLGGLRFWVGEYQHKTWTLEQISDYFAGSAEFQSRYGSLSNAAFIDQVYWNVLGRAPDPGGGAYWIAELDSGRRTRGQVMLAFSESPEYRALSASEVYVTLAYAAILRRAVDPGGLQYWVGQLDSGVPGTTLTNALYYSPEYYYRFLP